MNEHCRVMSFWTHMFDSIGAQATMPSSLMIVEVRM